MLNNILALINQEGSLGFGEACLYALIGFLIVFLGITIIIFIIWLIGLILRKTNNFEFLSKIGRKKNKVVETTVNVPDMADGDIPDEVKAAIIAAIMTYYSDEKPECEFRVRRCLLYTYPSPRDKRQSRMPSSA